jgi:hypothetical protein
MPVSIQEFIALLSDSDRMGKVRDLAVRKVKDELRQQGHIDTGKLLDSIEAEIDSTQEDLIEIIGSNEFYGRFLNDGVPANRIRPARRRNSRGGGSGRKSPRQEAIEGWLRRKVMPGASDKEVTGRYFAIVNTWRKVGFPSPGGKKFAPNGRNKRYIGFAIEENEGLINLETELASEDAVTAAFFQTLEEVEQKLK